jgi:hypothetical protein
LHTVRRHGGRVEAVAILLVDIPRAWLRRNRKGLWYCTHDIPADRIRRVPSFAELAGASAARATPWDREEAPCSRHRQPRSDPMFEDADLVNRYTRADAIHGGVLIDVSAVAREAGIRYPTALTRAVLERCVAVPPGVLCQDERPAECGMPKGTSSSRKAALSLRVLGTAGLPSAVPLSRVVLLRRHLLLRHAQQSRRLGAEAAQLLVVGSVPLHPRHRLSYHFPASSCSPSCQRTLTRKNQLKLSPPLLRAIALLVPF